MLRLPLVTGSVVQQADFSSYFFYIGTL